MNFLTTVFLGGLLVILDIVTIAIIVLLVKGFCKQIFSK